MSVRHTKPESSLHYLITREELIQVETCCIEKHILLLLLLLLYLNNYKISCADKDTYIYPSAPQNKRFPPTDAVNLIALSYSRCDCIFKTNFNMILISILLSYGRSYLPKLFN